ncbi:hypothetical protein EJB05_45814, partial [Eragrostis curvula]
MIVSSLFLSHGRQQISTEFWAILSVSDVEQTGTGGRDTTNYNVHCRDILALAYAEQNFNYITGMKNFTCMFLQLRLDHITAWQDDKPTDTVDSYTHPPLRVIVRLLRLFSEAPIG